MKPPKQTHGDSPKQPGEPKFGDRPGTQVPDLPPKYVTGFSATDADQEEVSGWEYIAASDTLQKDKEAKQFMNTCHYRIIETGLGVNPNSEKSKFKPKLASGHPSVWRAEK